MENEIVKKDQEQLSFIERLVDKAQSLEDIKKVGMVIIESGFCPDHFKQSKDAVGVIMCIEAGRKIGISWMQALSDIYPVKGRVGIMGSTARALIFSKNIVDYWNETTEGVYPNDDYKHIIISKRKDQPGEFRTEFSVFDAKAAALWTKDIYKKYGKRMLSWRAVSFHATDYYGDIMKGMKTTEELQDYENLDKEYKTYITTKDGKKILVDESKLDQSEQISKSVVGKIDQNHKPDPEPEIKTESGEQEEGPKVYTEQELLDAGITVYDIAKQVLPQIKLKILETMPNPKRKTKVFWKNAILAHQKGEIDAFIQSNAKEEKPEAKEEDKGTDTEIKKEPEASTQQELNPNKDFDKEQSASVNIDIPEVDESGKREDMAVIYNIFEAMEAKKVDNVIIKNLHGGKYKDLEDFCTRAPKSEIEILLK